MLDSGCIECSTASLQRGPGGHDVIDQHHLSAPGGVGGAKGLRHVGAPLARRQAALLSGRSLPLQQLRGKRCAYALGQRTAEQASGIEASLDEARIMEWYRHHDSLRHRAAVVQKGPRQQAGERARQVGSAAELEASDRRRKRRDVAAADAGEGGSDTRRGGGARTTRRAKDVASSDRGIASGARVRSNQVRKHAPARARDSSEALPLDHAPLIGTRTARLRSPTRDPSDRGVHPADAAKSRFSA